MGRKDVVWVFLTAVQGGERRKRGTGRGEGGSQGMKTCTHGRGVFCAGVRPIRARRGRAAWGRGWVKAKMGHCTNRGAEASELSWRFYHSGGLAVVGGEIGGNGPPRIRCQKTPPHLAVEAWG